MKLVHAAGVFAIAMAGSVMLAQHALDASIRRGANRQNPATSQQSMARPIYTVNKYTGEMMYNRAQAFNDPAYNRMYRRHTSVPIPAPRPAGGGSVGSLSRPAYSIGRSFPTTASRYRATGSTGLVATRRVQPQSLAAQRYSPLRVSNPYQVSTTGRRAR